MHLVTALRSVLACSRCVPWIGCMALLVAVLVPQRTWAGMLGYPAASQRPFHLRFELAGDSFIEEITGSQEEEAEANSARALFTAALGLTEWSEVYVRLGVADFAVDEALFNGGIGLAYGGGIRLRLAQLPFGVLGVTGQYLRFTSNDGDSAGVRVKGEWEEFDLALGIGTRRLGPFQFYVGGAYHHAEMTLKAEAGARTKLETDVPFRLFFGANIFPLADFPGGQFLINIEARVIGETPQFTLGVQYAF